jgi:hypothetical protein
MHQQRQIVRMRRGPDRIQDLRVQTIEYNPARA